MRRTLLATLLFLLWGSKMQAVASDGDTLSMPITIFLSFDDGPYDVSYRIDSIARADSVPITAFVTGISVNNTPRGKKILALYRINPFIEIANHSYYHAHKRYKQFYSHPPDVVQDILLNEDTLGLTNKLVRLPGRNTWRTDSFSRTDLADANAAADILFGKGYTIVGWDLEWMHGFTAPYMMDAIKHLLEVKNEFSTAKVVILCHDPLMAEPVFLEEFSCFIRLAKEAGFVFRRLSEYGMPLPPAP